jgi:F-type H+-transporting ATPase subunit epsilon
MAQLKCTVVTPERTALEQEATFVVAPLFDGELGIAPGHTPLIGRLGFGELRVTQPDGEVQRHYVDGGFLHLVDNEVTLLTGQIVAAADLDEEVAREQLAETMKRPVPTDEMLQQRDRAVARARSQIRVARRASR